MMEKEEQEQKQKQLFEFIIETFVVPFPSAGEVIWNGKPQSTPFRAKLGDTLEFTPVETAGILTWKLEVIHQGMSVIATVEHQEAGRYVLRQPDMNLPKLNISEYVRWEALAVDRKLEQEKFEAEIQTMRIAFGRRPQVWEEMLAVRGRGIIVVAEAKQPIAPIPPVLQDFVETVVAVAVAEEDTRRVDFSASKIKLIPEGAVLARKIPGTPGVNGTDIFGRTIPAPPLPDFQFTAKKNVVVSDDGLEVISSCAGMPVRVNKTTYMVEHVYVLNQDVDLSTGSIDFPGDVYVYGNVEDGMHIYAGGKVEIRGSVSHAEIRAEKGLVVHNSFLGGKAVVGEQYVVRSEIFRLIGELADTLKHCLEQTARLMSSPGAEHLKPGQCLKLIIERNFADLPKLATDTEKYILNQPDPLVTEGLQIAVRTAKRFLVGLGPMDPQAIPLLNRVNSAFVGFIDNLALEIPDQLTCKIGYAQGAVIECGGQFECFRGAYNSTISVMGDIKINGVCRGGKVIGGGRVEISELGGSGVSHTFVQLSRAAKLFVGYCHANVVVSYNKQIISIDEPCRQLQIYLDRGIVQVDKFKIQE